MKFLAVTGRPEIYISNFQFYEKGGAGSGAAPIDPRPFRYSGAFFDLSSGVYTKDFVNFWQTSMQSIAKPGSGTVEETLVIGTVEHTVANTDVLNLTPGVDYILEFDFWADTAGNGFHVYLVTPDWNYVFAGHRQATKTPQHAKFTINSSSAYINNVNLRFFYNSGAGNNVGNVYISNVRLYNKAAADNGWYLGTDSAVKVCDFKWYTNSNITTVVPPGRIKAVEALSIKPINHAVASTDTMSLRQDTEYILEFDYWGDVAGDIIITDLFPDDLPESFFLVSTSVKRARISISSNSANMNASCLRFFINTGYGYTNQGNVYAANILFYEKNSIGKAPADTNPFRYTGEYFDYEMGTYYLRVRTYLPRIGRFLTEDPVHAGLNWYTYCSNDPINRIDPWGLDDVIIYANGKGKSDWTKQAEYLKKELEKQGRTVRFIDVKERKSFETAWKDLGTDADGNKYALEKVYIISYGSERSLILVDGSSTEALSINGFNKNGDRIGNISDLETKNISYLYLLSCNAGNLDQFAYGTNENGGVGNIASVFSTRLEDGVVLAYDGNVGFGLAFFSRFGVGGYAHRLSNDQSAFYDVFRRYNENANLRKPKENLIFYYNGDFAPRGYFPRTSIGPVNN